MSDILFIFIKALLVATLTILVRYGIPYLKALVDTSKYKWLKAMATDAVKAAEQTIKASGSGPQRKLIVTKFLKKVLTAKNISITDDQLDEAIEAAVYTMNHTKPSEAGDSDGQ